MDTTPLSPEKFTAKDLVTDQDVRWCPGCGDYSILKQVQTVMPDLGIRKRILYLYRVSAVPRVFRITWKPTACTAFTDAPRLLPAA
jgi:pyruvate/2-oxoacid:ferredoxin oxidoreductase beta subunit